MRDSTDPNDPTAPGPAGAPVPPRAVRRWQDPVNACLGVAILLSPFLAGYALVLPALANAMIVGTFVFTAAAGAEVIDRPWVEGVMVALGAWMVASPWALAITDEVPRKVAALTGALILLLGLGAFVVERRARRDDPQSLK